MAGLSRRRTEAKFVDQIRHQRRLRLRGVWPTAYYDVWLETDHKRKNSLWCDLTFWAVQFLSLCERK